jgi:thymidylate synthase
MDFYIKLLQELNTNGLEVSPRSKNVKELIDVKFYVDNNETLINLPEIRDVVDQNTKEGQYLRAEFVWYMSGNIKPDFISLYGSMWKNLTNKFNENDSLNGMINSNYGTHVFYLSPTLGHDNNEKITNQFDWVLNELIHDRDSRKAIIQYVWPPIYMTGVRDFTCTQNQHFFIRNDRLINLINIRSSDAIKGLTFDIPWWDFVGQALAQQLNITYENMVVNIGSSHYYDSDNTLVENIINNSDKFNRKKLLINSFDCISENTTNLYDYIINYYKNVYNNAHINDNYTNEQVNNIVNNNIGKNKLDIDNINSIDIIKYLSNLHVNLACDMIKYIDKNELTIINNKIFDLTFRIEEAK